ncbi:MAG TPA: A/G-specific adenine glycosylase [Anaerolineae bacterium]|nr:A/G-specific adenine glycosylase [Anaerolineae bacterium]
MTKAGEQVAGKQVAGKQGNRPALARKLIKWFEAQARDLPWRRRRTPYRVWLSEMMLQQTQVDTVIPYFKRFTARFPNLKALANARIDEVLKLWEGLGYYARARNLHRAAQVVSRELGGRFPQTVEGLLQLPGIGRYSAGAIASLAFGVDAPILDGNVARVLCRVFSIERDPREPATRAELWALAEALLPKGRAAQFNEGLMELGALVCTPRAPKCAVCPIALECEARRLGIQDRLPVKRARKVIPHYAVTAAVIRQNGRVLIAQRPLDKMLGGLWEFPGGKCEPGETLEECLKREIGEELSLEIEVADRVGVVKHSYTHFRITLHAFECRVVAGRPKAVSVADFKWVRLREIDRYAFATTDRKIIERLREAG